MLRTARSVLALLLIVLWYVLGGLFQRLVVWPAYYLFPHRRTRTVTAYMKMQSAGTFAILRAGGARFRRTGTLPTAGPILILMNHQSLLDITTVVLMSRPYSPAFVARRRYRRFVPAVSLCMRLLHCAIIDPARRRESLRAMAEAARRQEHGMLVFPEGHRTRDGEIQPFHTAGAAAMLRARPVPVYLVVTDGFWQGGHLRDFVRNVPKIDGHTEVLGPFEPPPPSEIPRFLAELRERMIEHLKRMREGRRDAA